MSKGIVKGIIIILVLLTMEFKIGYSQVVIDQPVRLMFYNVENLFDIDDDTLRNDEDFLPGGLRGWNFTRYNRKINSLYKTIVAAGGWNPPPVIALCEVENRKVLEYLVYRTYLSKYNYGIIHEESPDHRGIDVCMIYKKDIADIIDYRYWVPSGSIDKGFTSRSVLYAKLKISTDTIHIIVNHWPSRRGGVLAAENLRKSIAVMVRTKVDSLVENSRTVAKIIIMGDFNCSPGNQVMRLLTGKVDSPSSLINLSEKPAIDGMGTYRYQGIWEMIDQVIVSNGLFKSKGGLYTDEQMFNIFNPDFLLFKDPKYPGFTPFSTYRGYRYQGGYSDHLPVLLDLRMQYQVQQE